ncbi:MAG: extracellular solute-binding protein [Patescibacteria group bacterium]|jgi:ABC-type glycerol-3-phosphate transport system substrate-binding protein
MNKYLLGSLLIGLTLIGAGCFGPQPVQMTPVALEYWRVDDEPEDMAEIIAAYQKLHPQITINYVKMAPERYKQLLLEALAEDRGPDLFVLPNVALREWQAKLLPLPKETSVVSMAVNQQKQIVPVEQKKTSLTVRELNNSFVEAVVQDVVMAAVDDQAGGQVQDAIFGLPLSLDTLALYYNKDLLKAANIEKPPATWSEFLDLIPGLTTAKEDGTVTQSGASIGTADNIRYSTELLASIMQQNGAVLADDRGYAQFDQRTPETSGDPYPPGVHALMFYVSFAEPSAPNYAWNNKMPDSLDAFVSGKTAFYFGYPHDARLIKERAPKLNFTVAPLPQVNPGRQANIAKYPVEVVSKKTAHADEAWDFLQYLSQKDKVTNFLVKTLRPTALRSLVSEQITNPDTGAFAGQVLTAKSWYRGQNYAGVEKAFATMINTKPSRERPEYQWIVSAGVAAVNQTLRD